MPLVNDLLNHGALLGATLPVQQWTIGLIVAAVGVALLMPHATKAARGVGAALAAIGVGVIFASLPWEAGPLTKSLFYVLAALTLVSALGALYCAVWFAASLLGVAGLLVLAGAQFLGVATIVVYAGAIVVTFLFVIMLAQPKGNESYDRVSWGSLSKPVAVFASAALVAASIFAQQEAVVKTLRAEVTDALVAVPKSDDYPKLEPSDVVAARYGAGEAASKLQIMLRPTIFPAIPERASQASEQPALDARRTAQDAEKAALAKAFATTADERRIEKFDLAKTEVSFESSLPINDTDTTRHVEALGVNLFGNQLVAVQVAGVLLLVALVGAISILTHDAPAPQRSEAAT
jgi:NADH-quinone oxidoreductase subunit J